ncbi:MULTISPECIES: ABC transporter permease [Kitasatospora]|uniref:ABC-2 type transporter transmembrane domain-containing protein n=1 Tax=Kitasatospora cystarginea TaxID=58350 RepID=A0ABN3DKR3_9ACTN
MGEHARRHLEAIRTGYLIYLADNPLKVQLTTTLPRLLLQGIFYTMLGRLVGGQSGAHFAFIGAIAFAACTDTVIGVCDVPMTDQWSGTYYRLQTGALPPGAVYLCRSLPYLTSGFLYSLLVLLVDGPVLGFAGSLGSLTAVLPLYLLTATTSTMFGLALAALAVGGSRDVLYGNLGSYFVLAASAIVSPLASKLRWLAVLGEVLPLGHGLKAIRAATAGSPWLVQLALEVLVGLGWLAVALLVVQARDRAARGRRVSVGRLHS